MSVILLNAPESYRDELSDVLKTVQAADNDADFIHFFTLDKEELSTRFSTLKRMLKMNGSLWISWPKKAAKVPTTLDENIVASIGLSHGLVDTKVCAIDDVWSGLKFMYRVKDRH